MQKDPNKVKALEAAIAQIEKKLWTGFDYETGRYQTHAGRVSTDRFFEFRFSTGSWWYSEGTYCRDLWTRVQR